MRWFITAVVIGVVALAAVAADGAQGPSVWLAAKSPVVVSGSGFAPRHSVVVTYRASALHRQLTVNTSAAGRITAVFRGVTFARCSGARVVAGEASLIVRACASAGGRPILLGSQSGLVTGMRFLPHERVQLVGRASGQATVTESVVAGPSGGFATRVRVQKVACAEVFYRATGALGSTATFTLPAPDCKAP